MTFFQKIVYLMANSTEQETSDFKRDTVEAIRPQLLWW